MWNTDRCLSMCYCDLKLLIVHTRIDLNCSYWIVAFRSFLIKYFVFFKLYFSRLSACFQHKEKLKCKFRRNDKLLKQREEQRGGGGGAIDCNQDTSSVTRNGPLHIATGLNDWLDFNIIWPLCAALCFFVVVNNK